jgi:hypothetical protein
MSLLEQRVAVVHQLPEADKQALLKELIQKDEGLVARALVLPPGSQAHLIKCIPIEISSGGLNR